MARRTATALAAVILATPVLAQSQTPPQTLDCQPACRSGYVCYRGVCVSACNPPCDSDETCRPDGECEPAPAPSTSTSTSTSTPTPTLPPTAVPTSTSAPGVRTHDGFYFDVAFGPLFETSNASMSTSAGTQLGFHTSGWGVGGQLAFGGTPLPGLVVGGASYGAFVPGAGLDTVSVNGASAPSNDKKAYSSTLLMIGPFVSWYPTPTDGFHADAALCFVTLNVDRQDDPNTFLSGNGFGFVVSGGYEWWIADEWSIGASARVQAAFPSLHDNANQTYGSTLVVPGALVSATYH